VRAGSDYDETVKLVLHTALDPRKSNQQLRGIAQLPHGTGKEVRVAVFAEGAKAQEALDAGADVVGTDELVDMIKAGNIDFDRCIATPNMMPVIGTVARILGPKGLVPSPKLGTLTMNIKEAVEAAKQGEIVLRANEHGEIQAAVGKLSFPSASITENIAALMKRVLELKPDGHKKGVLVLDVDLTTCQGPRIRVKCNQAPFRG
jgi:large subunit ribosomal protein L1